MAACPTHIDVPKFIKKIASANLRGSALTILDANILGLSCSRVCPVDVLCEGACVMHRYNKQPIEIGRLQRHAMDYFYSHSPSLPVGEMRGKRVACVGAGPASLACAAELRKRGYAVTIFDRQKMPGGLNTYGIAEYKLRPADSLKETELVRSMGVEFRLGVEADPQRLEGEFDAVFLGVGLGASHRLNIPGEGLAGVVDALSFIADYKTGSVAMGRRVVVIGAGNTAIDAATAAVRLGASEVHILYRRGEAEMPAFEYEYELAKLDRIEFHWHAQPVRIHGSTAVERIECAGGFTLPCDMVILAIGQARLIDVLERFRGVGIEGGLVRVNRETGQTANPKYFAGGDCVNGGREVVDAVADGKRAGMGIAAYLEASHG
jgi:glutamate synthase (NADPH/NADH) small chain